MFTPADPAFEARVRSSFVRQRVMRMLDATLDRVAPGEVDILLPYRADLTQQHGFLHAGIVATVGDSACGYAAFSLMPAAAAVLTVEFKINLMAPAQGDRFLTRGRVLRAGRTLTVCQADVSGVTGESERVVATMLATIMTVSDRSGVRG